MNEKILIVEDDKMIAELEREYLTANGFAVDICNDGLSGYGSALQNDYSLIILDVMLPGLDGFELCKKLRASKDTPVLFVTAKQEPDYVIEGFSLGADDYITKPFNILEVKARIKAIMRRNSKKTAKAAKLENNMLVRGDLKLDRESRRVFIQEKEINLTAKEFDLLELLVTNPNKVYSREALLNYVWGNKATDNGDVRTVDVHVRRLREKIEPSPSDPKYVHTKWGVGYFFRA